MDDGVLDHTGCRYMMGTRSHRMQVDDGVLDHTGCKWMMVY